MKIKIQVVIEHEDEILETIEEEIGDFGTTPQKRSIQNLGYKLTPEGQKMLKFAGNRDQYVVVKG